MQRRTERILAALIVVTALAGCATWKDRLRAANYVVSVTAIQTDKYVYDYVDTPEGTHQLCNDLEQLYGEQIKECQGDQECEGRVETLAVEDCQRRIASFEHRFDAVLNPVYDMVQTTYDTANLAGSIEKKQAQDIICNSMTVLNDLLGFLVDVGVPVPKQLTSALSTLEAFMK